MNAVHLDQFEEVQLCSKKMSKDLKGNMQLDFKMQNELQFVLYKIARKI